MTKPHLIRAHFKNTDSILYNAIPKQFDFELVREIDPFFGLCRIIISQQLSTKAARSIRMRFVDLFPQQRVTAEVLTTLTETDLRAIGIAGAKVMALKELAHKIDTKAFVIADLNAMSDVEAAEHLTTLRGIGPWSADMYLAFYLGHEDIFALGDQALRRAVQKLYGFKAVPSDRTLKRISKCWRPYRSYASLVLWHYLDTMPD